jgi:hypothetical protein
LQEAGRAGCGSWLAWFDPLQIICALGPVLKRSEHDPPRRHAVLLHRGGGFMACIDAIRVVFAESKLQRARSRCSDAALMTDRVISRCGES